MSLNQYPGQFLLDRIDYVYAQFLGAINLKARFLLPYSLRFWHLAFFALSLFIASSAKAQFLEIKCDKPQLVYNDHVGNEWSYAFELGEKYFTISTVNYFSLADLSKVRLIVSETNETYNDFGAISIGIDASTLEWDKLYSKSLEVIIKERNGRYAGNTAKWKFTIHYKKIHGRT